jgi:hypothetical protein
MVPFNAIFTNILIENINRGDKLNSGGIKLIQLTGG